MAHARGISLDTRFPHTNINYNLIYFFLLQCHWHGCRKCFPCERNETKTPLTKQSMEELYVITKKREQTIRGLGYGYRRIWEHEFASRLNSNTRLKIFAENHEIEERLDPRHAFFVSKQHIIKHKRYWRINIFAYCSEVNFLEM